MLTINEDTFIKISSKLRDTPKDIYLCGSMDLVRKHFQNAYVITSVNWGFITSFLNFFSIDPIPENQAKIRRDLYTVIPFTPVKNFWGKVTDWKLPQNDYMVANATMKNVVSAYVRNNNIKARFMAFLLQNSNSMKIIVRGVEYNSPCEFCKSIFSRITNQCELYDTEMYSRQTCNPRVHFASKMFNPEEDDVKSNLELSREILEQAIDV